MTTPVNVAAGAATVRDYHETVTRAVGVTPVWDDAPAWTGRVLADRDRLLEQARAEAARIVQLGQEEQARLVEATAVYTRAQTEADRMLDQAHAEAEAMRLQTEDYVTGKFG